MTNAEKYKDAIKAQLRKTGAWAVDRTGKIMPCALDNCAVCTFSSTKNFCLNERKKWLNAEVKKTFSEKDKEVIRALDKAQWVARDKDGRLCIYATKPSKNSAGFWDANFPFMSRIGIFSTAEFAPVKWEDDEPRSREEILGEEK